MIGLGRGPGLEVRAGGTEIAEEVAWLEARGCELFQGHIFSRPVPSAALGPAFHGGSRALA